MVEVTKIAATHARNSLRNMVPRRTWMRWNPTENSHRMWDMAQEDGHMHIGGGVDWIIRVVC